MAKAINYAEKDCASCGKRFKPNNARRIYCSTRCRRGEAACVQCGIVFVRKGNTTGSYCSLACWYAAPGKRVYAERQCLQCGATFLPGSKNQAYCKPECAHLAKRKERAFKECQTCGKELPFKLSKRTLRYCSRACALTGQERAGISAAKIGATAPGPNGYRLVKVGKGYPGAFTNGWMVEHRYIMEQKLGRPLEKHERVHHKDGNRANNDPSNLELWKLKKKDPAGVRADDYHCPGCRCFEKE